MAAFGLAGKSNNRPSNLSHIAASFSSLASDSTCTRTRAKKFSDVFNISLWPVLMNESN